MFGLLGEVAEGEEFETTENGQTVARLVGATGSHQLKGRLSGAAVTAADEEYLFTTQPSV